MRKSTHANFDFGIIRVKTKQKNVYVPNTPSSKCSLHALPTPDSGDTSLDETFRWTTTLGTTLKARNRPLSMSQLKA